MSAPGEALRILAGTLREEGSVISPLVVEPDEAPALGILAASGPRAATAPVEYALVVEAVREGYMLHYGEGRVIADADADLALLAGDYLYALGLERLARIGDLAAVRELSDLISLASQIHDGTRPPDRARDESVALWLAAVTAIAVGAGEGHERAKRPLRGGEPGAAATLRASAAATAGAAGLGEQLQAAAFAIDFGADVAS